MSGNTLTASAGANTVFTFALNGTTGAWTFTLVGHLDHAAGADENNLTINLSSIVRATDSDSDRSPPAPLAWSSPSTTTRRRLRRGAGGHG